MCRNSFINFIFLITSTYCTILADKEVTFKNVHIQITRNFKLDINITESNSLKEHLPEENELIVELVGNIPKLYENSIADIDNLIKLEFLNNSLYEIELGAFKNLSKLRELTIIQNQLTEIRKGIFNNLLIEELYLGYNKIEIIEYGAFGNLPKLKNIHLDSNRLRYWKSQWFENVPNLNTIFVIHNSIQELPDDAFNNITNHNQSMYLYFGFNLIRKINRNTFRNLNQIDKISLGYNWLESLEENWLSGTTVKDLDIDNNELTCLNGDIDKIFTAESIDIDRNPWRCSCLKKILEYSRDHKKQIEMTESRNLCNL